MKPFTLGQLQAMRITAVRALISEPGSMAVYRTATVKSGIVTVAVRRGVVGPLGARKVRPIVRYLLNGRPVRRATLETQAAAGYL